MSATGILPTVTLPAPAERSTIQSRTHIRRWQPSNPSRQAQQGQDRPDAIHGTMTDLYAATSKHLLLRQYPSAISTVHALLNDLRSRHPFIYNRPERSNSSTPALLLQWESYPYSTIQALKLLCTVYVSAWSSGVTASEVLRKTRTAGKKQDGTTDTRLDALAKSLPPNSSAPEAILETTLGICLQTLTATQPAHLGQHKNAGNSEENTSPVLALPPSLLLTFLLACLKISSSSDPATRSSATQASSRGEESAIPFARKLFEDWLVILPDEALYALAQARPMRTPRKSAPRSAPLDTSTSSVASSVSSLNNGNESSSSPSASLVLVDTPSEDDQDRSLLLQFKKDYLRLVEVYVLEVLPRQDDWDIASDFVMGDFVMGAKRKEQMLKRLHDAKAKHIASATRARRSSANLTRNTGGPTSMTSMSSTSAVEGEDLDTETVIAGGAANRAASRRSSNASTERTARPYDRGSRASRATAVRRDVGTSADAEAAQEVDEVRHSGRVSAPTPALDAEAPAPAPRSISSFAALRNRIIEYLDEPLSEPRSTTPRAAENNAPGGQPRRSRRSDSAQRWNVLQFLRPKSFALVAAVIALLVARRQWKRRSQRSLTSAQNIGSTMPLWYIVNAEWWKAVVALAWQKLRTMLSMGTTLTYV